MKLSLSAFALLLVLSFSACKKEKDVNKALPKVKTITYVNLSLTYTYTYDAQGRLSRKDYALGQHQNFTYTAGTVVAETYNSSNVISESTVYFLNAQSLADSSVTNYGGGNMLYLKFRYDAAGHLIETKMYDALNTYSYARHFTYENGNQSEFYNARADGTYLENFSYTYDAAHTNTIANANIGLDFLGVESKNPYASYVDFAVPDYLAVFDYAYTYDSEGRITSRVESSPTGTGQVTYTYY